MARERKGGWIQRGYEETFRDGGCIHWFISFLDCEDAFTTVYICLTHVIVHFKYVQFTVSQYLNKAVKKKRVNKSRE